MPKLKSTGVYQKENGFWEYRFGVVIDGKTIVRKKCKDEHGNKLKTRSEAVRAREAAIDHFLRHTFGTMMAEMNTPTHLLCNQMGHGNIHVTQRYYIAISKSGMDILKQNLNHL